MKKVATLHSLIFCIPNCNSSKYNLFFEIYHKNCEKNIGTFFILFEKNPDFLKKI